MAQSAKVVKTRRQPQSRGCRGSAKILDRSLKNCQFLPISLRLFTFIEQSFGLGFVSILEIDECFHQRAEFCRFGFGNKPLSSSLEGSLHVSFHLVKQL